MQDCDSAVQRDDHEFAAFFNRGNVEMRLKAYPQALESFRTAADLAPGISGEPHPVPKLAATWR